MKKESKKYNFEGRVALITGGGGGIGRAIANTLAYQGATVVVADIDVKSAVETVKYIKDNGGIAIFIKMDVTNEKNVKEMIAFTVKNYGRLDFACNNAGIDEGELVSLVELSKDRWDKILAVNLTGVYLCMRYELKYMLTQGYGAIVNIASVAGIIGTKGKAAYVATKHGIIGLTKTAALEVANKSIRINAVAPGLVNAGLTISAPEEFTRRALKAQPIGRMAEAEEIASAVAWLCSDEASFVLGHTLILDGGMTIQ